MKIKFLIAVIAFVGIVAAAGTAGAQSISVSSGPQLTMTEGKKINRIIDGDNNTYYSVWTLTKGEHTMLTVEMHVKDLGTSRLLKEFKSGNSMVKVEDILYSRGKLIFFFSHFDMEKKITTLSYQMISEESSHDQMTEILNLPAASIESATFDFSQRPDNTKFLVKITKRSGSYSKLAIQFALINIKGDGLAQEWVKDVPSEVLEYGEFRAPGKDGGRGDAGILDCYLDNDDNIFYGYITMRESAVTNRKNRILTLGILYSAPQSSAGVTSLDEAPTSGIIELPVEGNLSIANIRFYQTGPAEMSIAGFMKEQKANDEPEKVSLFTITVDVDSQTVKSSGQVEVSGKFINQGKAPSTQSEPMSYRLGYVLPYAGDFYFIGEEYREQHNKIKNAKADSAAWEYEYRNLIVAKMNGNGTFEWQNTAPLRNLVRLSHPQFLRMYFATAVEGGICLLYNDHFDNFEQYGNPDFEPRMLTNSSDFTGSSFILSRFILTDGTVTHHRVVKNDAACFLTDQEQHQSLAPPRGSEIFVPGPGRNEMFIRMSERGRNKIEKLTIAFE